MYNVRVQKTCISYKLKNKEYYPAHFIQRRQSVGVIFENAISINVSRSSL